MLAMGPPLFIVRAVQTGGNSHRSRSSSPSVFRKLPAIVRDHSPYPPNAVATSGRHTHPIVKTEKPCSSYISQTRLPHTPKATCSHSYNVRCRAVSFPQTSVCLYYAPGHRRFRCIPQRVGWHAIRHASPPLHCPKARKRRRSNPHRQQAALTVLRHHTTRLLPASFSRSNLGKRLFQIGDEVVRILQAHGQSNQIGGNLQRGTGHGGVGHGTRMAYARNRPRHIRRRLVHVLSSGWPKILSLSTRINHVMFVFSKADNNSFACTGN